MWVTWTLGLGLQEQQGYTSASSEGVCREEGKRGRIGEDEAIPLGTQNPLTGLLGLAVGQGFPKFYYYEPVINNSLWDKEDVGNKLAFEMYP